MSYLYKKHPGYTNGELSLMGATSLTDRLAMTVDPASSDPSVARRNKEEMSKVGQDMISTPPEPMLTNTQGQLIAGAAVLALILLLAR